MSRGKRERQWAIVVRTSRGTEWLHYHTIRPTRRESINAFDALVGPPGRYERDRRKGRVRAAKVEVSWEASR